VYNPVALEAGRYGQSSAWLRRSRLNLGCTTVRWMDGISFRMYRIHNLCKWIYKTKQRAWRSQCFQRAGFTISRRSQQLGSSVLLLRFVECTTIAM